ncbi:hypothetical protein EV363DRAFT_1399755 [Boletus edulis]|nr:hypothetical protein EV363DRAFT_1399755 [Boletus edulis]
MFERVNLLQHQRDTLLWSRVQSLRHESRLPKSAQLTMYPLIRGRKNDYRMARCKLMSGSKWKSTLTNRQCTPPSWVRLNHCRCTDERQVSRMLDTKRRTVHGHTGMQDNSLRMRGGTVFGTAELEPDAVASVYSGCRIASSVRQREANSCIGDGGEQRHGTVDSINFRESSRTANGVCCRALRDRVTADERVLDRVSGAYKSSATTIDDVTIAQKSATSVRPGYVDQSTTPRRTATVDSLEKPINPDRIRATTAYNVVDVEVDRTVVGRPTTMETPFSELDEVQKDANQLLGDTSAPPSRVQTSSNVACSTQGSVVRKDTSLKASGECVAGNMSTQRSEKQVDAGRVDFLADAQDVDVIETREQTTYITSS